jgi:uncharacterized protein
MVEDQTVAPPTAPQAYGPWASLGLTMVVLAAIASPMLLAAAGVFLLADWGAGEATTQLFFHPAFAPLVEGVGFFPIEAVLLFWLIRRREGWSTRRYLALEPTPWRQLAAWPLAGVFASRFLWWASEAAGWRPLVGAPPQFETALEIPLWALVAVVVGPLGEEALFRGFLFRGIAGSRLGVVGAVAVSTVLWGGLHLPRNLLGALFIAMDGALLGVARARTGSLTPAVAMHAGFNLIAWIEATLRFTTQG